MVSPPPNITGSDTPLLYCLQARNDLLLFSFSQKHTHNQEAYQTIYSSLLRLIISYFPYLCLPEDWIKQDTLYQGT